MRVSLQLFARARDLAGSQAVTLELPEGANISDLRQALQRAAPRLAPLAAHLFIAMNEDYARDEDLIPHGARLAAFPPVSGG